MKHTHYTATVTLQFSVPTEPGSLADLDPKSSADGLRDAILASAADQYAPLIINGDGFEIDAAVTFARSDEPKSGGDEGLQMQAALSALLGALG